MKAAGALPGGLRTIRPACRTDPTLWNLLRRAGILVLGVAQLPTASGGRLVALDSADALSYAPGADLVGRQSTRGSHISQ
jgi:hypothetical protein